MSRVVPIASLRAVRLGQNSQTLVVSEPVGADTGETDEFTKSHGGSFPEKSLNSGTHSRVKRPGNSRRVPDPSRG